MCIWIISEVIQAPRPPAHLAVKSVRLENMQKTHKTQNSSSPLSCLLKASLLGVCIKFLCIHSCVREIFLGVYCHSSLC